MKTGIKLLDLHNLTDFYDVFMVIFGAFLEIQVFYFSSSNSVFLEFYMLNNVE